MHVHDEVRSRRCEDSGQMDDACLLVDGDVGFEMMIVSRTPRGWD